MTSDNHVRDNKGMRCGFVRDSCRLCGSSGLETLLKLPATCLANQYPKVPEGADGWQDRFPLYLVGCRSCGHVQLPVVVAPERLFPPDYPYQSGTSPVFRRHLEELAELLATRVDPQWPRVLDIACNDGTFVGELRKRCMLATGIDPAAPEGKELVRDFFSLDWAENHPEQYDVVTALNVFAHVDDLDDFTAGVVNVLKPCGLFVFEVGYLPDVVRHGLFDVIYHEHLSYHHLTPLVPFFERHGMQIVDAQRIDSQGGSVRVFVRNCLGQHLGGDDGHQLQSDGLRELLRQESEPAREGLWNGVKRLGKVAKDLGLRISAFQKQSGQIAFYGAPAKLTTMLAAIEASSPFGVLHFNPQFVADDNPLKQGRYVPGTRIPILSTAALYERRPKGVVVSAWNFAEEIMERHRDLGCRWFVPFVRDR